MFDRTSRYYALDNATYQEQDGHHIIYKRRRFLPKGATMQVISVVSASPDDRLDLITARTLGVPDQFWRVCDANNAMNPFNLIEETGGLLAIAQPQFPNLS